MEFASYQEAKIAINKFDGAMTKGETKTPLPGHELTRHQVKRYRSDYFLQPELLLPPVPLPVDPVGVELRLARRSSLDSAVKVVLAERRTLRGAALVLEVEGACSEIQHSGIADFSLALQELEAVMPLVDEAEPKEARSMKAIWIKSSTTSWLPLRARRCVMIWRRVRCG